MRMLPQELVQRLRPETGVTGLLTSGLGMTALGTALGLVVHFLLAGVLGPAEYGIFSFIIALVIILRLLGLFGFQVALVRLIPGIKARDDAAAPARIGRLVRFALIFTLGVSLILSAAAFMVLAVLDIDAAYTADILLLGFCMVPLYALARIHITIIRAYKQSVRSIFYENVLRELGMLIMLGLMAFAGWKLADAGIALFAMTVVLAFMALVTGVNAWRLIPHTGHDRAGITRQEKRAEIREWLNTAWPFVLVAGFRRLMRRSDILILGLMVSPAQVGVYALATQFADGAGLATRPVLAVFGPRAAERYQAGDQAGLRSIYNSARIYMICTSAVLISMIAALAPYVMTFLDDGYRLGYTAMLILLAPKLIGAALGPMVPLMGMTAYEKTMSAYYAIAVTGNLVLTPVLIHFYGINGAALATTIMQLVFAGMCARFIAGNGLLRA